MSEGIVTSDGPLARILDLAEDAIISVDEDQRIVLYNKGAERIFGFSVEDACGQSLDLLLPTSFVEIHRRHFLDFAESSTISRRMGERKELFGRRKDGTDFPAEASISKSEWEGRRLYTVILRDITDRKRIQGLCPGVPPATARKPAPR
jgi:PAS domain S-box-containing protein